MANTANAHTTKAHITAHHTAHVDSFARDHLDIPEITKRILSIDVAQYLEAGDYRLAIDFCGKVVRLDTGLIEGIG